MNSMPIAAIPPIPSTWEIVIIYWWVFALLAVLLAWAFSKK